MKKISSFLLNNKKFFLGIIIGIIISGGTVFAATILFASNEVSYDNTNSGMSATNVQDALDELYTKTSKINIYKDLQCPGCVYRKSSTLKCNSNASRADGTNNKLTSSEYTTDYTTLNSNYFLGHVIDSNGYILSSYVCGINNGLLFCFRGVDSDQTSLTYKPFYYENVSWVNKAFPGCNATTSGPSVACYGEVEAHVYSDGSDSVDVGSSFCRVFTDGTSDCDE